MRFVRRVITRPASRSRDGEPEAFDGVDEPGFERLREAGGFALWWRAHGLLYGIPADISLDLARGRTVVANVSRAVIAEAAARFPVHVVEVTAPADLLARRLVARGREESELAPADAELAALAAEQSRAVAGLAAVLEQALG